VRAGVSPPPARPIFSDFTGAYGGRSEFIPAEFAPLRKLFLGTFHPPGPY
jgi:hypothetical protein